MLELSEPEREELGREYLKRARVSGGPQRPTSSTNCPTTGSTCPSSISSCPNAKIIDARRHPLVLLLLQFPAAFRARTAFTYDLEDIGRYYADYVRLMAHVDAVLPGRVHRQFYERMVDDTEAEVRRLLDYCGLEFEPQVLEFYRTDRPVRTASSEQVRRPIYRDATDNGGITSSTLGL